MRVAILCDSLASRGGSERLVLELAKAFDADVFTGFVGDTFPEVNQLKIITVGRRFRPSLLNSLYLWRTFSRLRLPKKYDAYIFSGNLSIAANRRHHPAIWYCLTPNRLLYVDTEYYLHHSSLYKRSTIRLMNKLLRSADQAHASHFDMIIADSKTVKERIRQIYGEEVLQRTEVIYPPVDTDKYKWISQEDYYLSLARLHPLKRVDLIIRAFQRLPDKKLVVVSGGPDLERIRQLAQGYPNIKVCGWVDDSELCELIGRCIATIYVPMNEDFGISPVEGMAAGKPCIGVAEGGLLETIVHGETGYLCPTDLNEGHLIEAVKHVTSSWALERRFNCESRAQIFSKKRFVVQMEEALRAILRQYQNQ